MVLLIHSPYYFYMHSYLTWILLDIERYMVNSLAGRVSDLFLQFLELRFWYGWNTGKFLWRRVCYDVCFHVLVRFSTSTFYYTEPISLFADALHFKRELKFSEC